MNRANKLDGPLQKFLVPEVLQVEKDLHAILHLVLPQQLHALEAPSDGFEQGLILPVVC